MTAMRNPLVPTQLEVEWASQAMEGLQLDVDHNDLIHEASNAPHDPELQDLFLQLFFDSCSQS